MTSISAVSGLITTAPDQLGLVVTKDQNTPLVPVTFTVDGRLDLHGGRFAEGRRNSRPSRSGWGRGSRTCKRIALNHVTGGACETATVMVGATPYTINCTTPGERGVCIEKTTAVTATLPSDNYQNYVKADQAAGTACFTNDELSCACRRTEWF